MTLADPKSSFSIRLDVSLLFLKAVIQVVYLRCAYREPVCFDDNFEDEYYLGQKSSQSRGHISFSISQKTAKSGH